MSDVKINGVEVEIGGTKYIVPPLNLKSLRLLKDELTTFQGKQDLESLSTVAKVAHASLLRNYPEITIEELEENIDLENMTEIMNAAMNVSGLVRQKEAQGKANL